MKYLFAIIPMLVSGSLVAGTLNLDKFQMEVNENNYFSASPASFVATCKRKSCLTAVTGHTNINLEEEVDQKSLATVGSLSKHITAALILMLVEEGQINLEDELVDYFPEYEQWRGVTVDYLLSHRSGIAPYLFSSKGIKKTALSLFNSRTRIWKPKELIEGVVNEPMLFAPGEKSAYNNTNYVLLGMIAEKATGESAEVLLDRYIFTPLGMNDTYLRLIDSEKHRRINGYFPMSVPVPDWLINLLSSKVEKIGYRFDTTNAYDESIAWTAGAITSTATDIAKFDYALFHGKLISKKMLAKMKSTYKSAIFGFEIDYGLGTMKMESEFGPMYGHGGLSPGYQTVSNYVPSIDRVLTIIQNNGPGQVYGVFFNLLAKLEKRLKTIEFIADDSVTLDSFKTGIHLRVKTKIEAADAKPVMFSPSIGFSLEKTKFGSKQPFLQYQALNETFAKEDFIRIKAIPGPDIFGSAAAEKTFFDVFIDKKALLLKGNGLYQDEDAAEMIVAYKGKYVSDENGQTSTCFEKISNFYGSSSFQIANDEGESYEIDETIKFSSNIALRKISSEELPVRFYKGELKICK